MRRCARPRPSDEPRAPWSRVAERERRPRAWRSSSRLGYAGSGPASSGLDDDGHRLAVSRRRGNFRVGQAAMRSTCGSRRPPRHHADHPVGNRPDRPHLHLGPGVDGNRRVIKEGSPWLAWGWVVQQDRNVDRFVATSRMPPTRHGRFAFANIPPSDAWFFYGLMDSLKSHGAIPIRSLRTGTPGDTVRWRSGGAARLPRDGRSSWRRTSRCRPRPACCCRARMPGTVRRDRRPAGRFSFPECPPNAWACRSGPGLHPSEECQLRPAQPGGDCWARLGAISRDCGSSRTGQPPERDFGRFGREDFEEYRRRQDSPLRGIPPGSEIRLPPREESG
jgi:hypothetical protein